MRNLEGVVTLLDEDHNARLKQVWQELHSSCEWKGHSPKDVPHFSWHVAETYDEDRLSAALEEFCNSQAPFEVHTAGLGIFTATKPVIYIALVKNHQLISLHSRLWERLQPLGQDASFYYAPDTWMPHITLAYEDLEPPKMGCLIERLAFKSFDWKITVDNLAMFGQANASGDRELIRFPFGKQGT